MMERYEEDEFIVWNEKESATDERLLFFLEGTSCPLAATVMAENYSRVARLFARHRLQLVFLPKLKEMVGEEVYRYVTGSILREPELVGKEALEGILPREVIGRTGSDACIVHYSQRGECYYISRIPRDAGAEGILEFVERRAEVYSRAARPKVVLDIAETHRDEDIRYCLQEDPMEMRGRQYGEKRLSPTPKKTKTDDEEQDIIDSNMETDMLLKRIQYSWQMLEQRGFTEEMLMKLLHDTARPGRLLIVDGKVTLPDMGGAEVKMAPLDRAFYILFLQHTEGISFKDMVDYKEDLLTLYRGLSTCRDRKKQRETIEKFVNPTENFMNVSASRIKRALTGVMSASLAEHYIIKGKQGEPKSISLDRSLLEIRTTSAYKMDTAEKRSFLEKLRSMFMHRTYMFLRAYVDGEE